MSDPSSNGTGDPDELVRTLGYEYLPEWEESGDIFDDICLQNSDHRATYRKDELSYACPCNEAERDMTVVEQMQLERALKNGDRQEVPDLTEVLISHALAHGYTCEDLDEIRDYGFDEEPEEVFDLMPEAHEPGVPDHLRKALVEADIPSSQLEVEVARALMRREATRRANLIEQREQGVGLPDLSDMPNTEDWLAQDLGPAEWLVEDLIQKGHTVLLGGAAGSGKTTLAIDLIHNLLESDEDWLDHLTVKAPLGNIGYLNMEMTDRQMHEWLRAKGIGGKGLSVLNLRSSPLNVMDPDHLTNLRNWIVAENIEFLVADTLSQLVSSAGLDENLENHLPVVKLNTLRQGTPLSEIMFLTHFGYGREGTRGSSKAADLADTEIKYLRDDIRRFIRVDTGRGTELPESQVMLDGKGRLVLQEGVSRASIRANTKSFNREQTKKIEGESLRDLIVKVVTDSPGFGLKELREAVRAEWHEESLAHSRIDKAIKVLDGDLIRVVKGGPGKKTIHEPIN